MYNVTPAYRQAGWKGGYIMKLEFRMEYLSSIYQRYHKSTIKEKGEILNEFCKVCDYNRKYAIRLLNDLPPERHKEQRKREKIYGPIVISILEAIWKASGYLWSQRLKAALPLWIPWAKKRFHFPGTTRPGTLLKHHIPIKTDSWDVNTPGFFEVDLVSHSGPSAAGEFIYSLDCTDIHTIWSERRAVM